jgi:anaerobic magnesium-protoporphyrin IX monomethyl ester cyclase
MRIILLHPPPWKINRPDVIPYSVNEGGPPQGVDPFEIDGDFLQIPYGLLSIAAQAQISHDVSIYNLSNFFWQDIEQLIKQNNADVFGLTSFTVNRRGLDHLSRLIKSHHQKSHIVVGGPHVTPIPEKILHYYNAIDTVVTGEGEDTFMELVSLLESGRKIIDLPGAVTRLKDNKINIGSRRERIKDLDSLKPVLDFSSSSTIMTSRGCPGQCTFCASRIIWGRKVKFHSSNYVLSTLRTAVEKYGLKGLAIKDDTFTANKQRVLDICHRIIKSDLNFLWSCDTRADSLSEELLYTMRLAGCQQISLGVESGSEKILKQLKKNILPEKILSVTRLAQKYGFQIRYYMITGNQGESFSKFKESLSFLRLAKPNSYFFSPLAYVPGTEEFTRFKELSGYTDDIFFTDPFVSLLGFVDVSKEDREKILQWLKPQQGRGRGWQYNPEDYLAMLPEFANHSPTHFDLAGAYLADNKFKEALEQLNQAIDLNYPLTGLSDNLMACIMVKDDPEKARELLLSALNFYPYRLSAANRVIQDNLIRLEKWVNSSQQTTLPTLTAYTSFAPTLLARQPEFPISISLQKNESYR